MKVHLLISVSINISFFEFLLTKALSNKASTMRFLLLIIMTTMFFINKFVVIVSSPPTTLIIDADKGIVLENIGVYSEKFDERVFHVFIPYNNLCVDSPTSNVCEYIQSTQPNILEIGTTIPYYDTMSTLSDKQNISVVIQQDIRRIFSYHRVDKFIERTKSIVFFIDNKFYVTGRINESSAIASLHSIDDNQQTFIYRTINPATLVVEQVFNNKVGFDFLTNEQLAELASLTVSSTDPQLDPRNVQENLNILTHTVLAQSVYALKSCSMSDNDNAQKSSACLVVSSMLRRISVESLPFYQVYRLTPLPVIFQGEKYAYADIPHIFGFNRIDKKVILWNDEKSMSSCVFSRYVYCREHPVSVPIGKIPCLQQLFSNDLSSSITNCEVIKSKDTQGSILNIYGNIWYFYPPDGSFSCESRSLTHSPMDTISIKQPMIVKLPCRSAIQCSDVSLPATSCVNATVTLKSTWNYSMNEPLIAAITLDNVTNRLVSIYRKATQNAFVDIESAIEMNASVGEKIRKEFEKLFLSIINFTLLTIILFIIKSVKSNTNRRIEKLQVDINKMRRDIIEEL